MEQNLSLYRIFFEVAQTGNISRAAKNLYISQPAISKAISKLEDNGYVILLTAGRSKCARLTESGLALAEATAGRIIAAEDRVYATWTPAELAAYLTLTERYLADLRRECDSLQK